ncbi:MAG: hypothetical protein FWG25_01685 [Promicromonosporaceae bacterium]|nr:hypothetical protein [Promicromonosporaceae bacterium]
MSEHVGRRGAHNAGKALEDHREHPREVGKRAAHDAAEALDDRKAEEK